MFKDEFPATYKAAMAYLSRQKQAAANDRRACDEPGAELVAEADGPAQARVAAVDAMPLLSAVSIALSVTPPAASDVSISIDASGIVPAATRVAAGSGACDLRLCATVTVRSLPR